MTLADHPRHPVFIELGNELVGGQRNRAVERDPYDGSGSAFPIGYRENLLGHAFRLS